MSILCHVAAQNTAKPAPEPRVDLTTPTPVYTAEPPLNAPTRLASHEQIQALAAMHHARKRYPGPVGDILCAEIQSYKDLGCVGQPSAPVVRLIRELMT